MLYAFAVLICLKLCRHNQHISTPPPPPPPPSLWLDGVLPMVMDREASAQEKCISILEEVLLSNINPPDVQ